MNLRLLFRRRDAVQQWAYDTYDGIKVESLGSFDGATYMVEVSARRRQVTECVIKRLDNSLGDPLAAIAAAERKPIGTADAEKLLALTFLSGGELRYIADTMGDTLPPEAAEKLRDMDPDQVSALIAHLAFADAAFSV